MNALSGTIILTEEESLALFNPRSCSSGVENILKGFDNIPRKENSDGSITYYVEDLKKGGCDNW